VYGPSILRVFPLFSFCPLLVFFFIISSSLSLLSFLSLFFVGLDMKELKEKLTEAKLLLKKSKRVNLYSILGVAKEHLASEQEIKTAYKKAALKWHPDRHSASNEEKKKEAENKFKEIGDVYEILIDPTKKRLWDQGCDREELDQRAEYAKQGGHGGGFSRGYGGHGNGHGGFGGFY
jgi:ABC-type multidrug transport system fused ATPase/permease subunit